METFPALQVTSPDLALLRENWCWLLSDCQSSDESKHATYLMLAKQYSSKNRFYHNLHHIAEMIRSIDSVRERLHNPQSVCLAVWFHDAVYNTRSSDNEEKSARLAMTEMEKLMVTLEHRQIVEKLILHTKTHDPE